ncbi:TIR domain-containing protein [Methylomonas sp. 2BW1-5-20]|uniref:TIR domain-containing protein n=1 Tax=Methylomonas sp. 2BW1-5-20 TaxID=3376686 RepID=UPI00405199C7
MASQDIFKIAQTLDSYTTYESEGADALIEAASEIGKSWSGSWLGYHSRIYYENFLAPPPGAAFSQEWGLMDSYSMGSRGAWCEYRFDDVVSLINSKAGNPSIENLFELGKKAEEAFDQAKTATLSLIHAQQHNLEKDKFLTSLVEKIEQAKLLDESDFIDYWRPKGQIISRDMVAIEKGQLVPPHFSVLARVNAAIFPFKACEELKKKIFKVASHIKNLEANAKREERIGTNIFIGHGRSPDWRELKDFVSDRLKLPWDEFNRVPVAGVTNITRLAQMLDQACFAFLVMTAEDEQADGNHHARMNVIHEVGLFQGRLGFERAIVLLEDGCEEFSNIQGLGQIRYPRGKVSAIFEDIRAVLERESIVE